MSSLYNPSHALYPITTHEFSKQKIHNLKKLDQPSYFDYSISIVHILINLQWPTKWQYHFITQSHKLH